MEKIFHDDSLCSWMLSRPARGYTQLTSTEQPITEQNTAHVSRVLYAASSVVQPNTPPIQHKQTLSQLPQILTVKLF